MDARNEREQRSLVTTRVFDAPRALVFDAWTHPNHLAHWWGPIGFSITTSAFDFRPGGIWRLVMHGPDGRDYQNQVNFDEISPPERLAFHHGGEGQEGGVSHSTLVTFEDIGGKTKLTMRMLFSSPEERDRVVREYGAAEGLAQTVGRLAEYVSNWGDNRGLEKSVSITRDIRAPRALVFQAFTEAEHLAKWWGPKGFTAPRCEIDLRPGGAIFIQMQGPGNFSHPMTGTVREVIPNERFVFTSVPQNDADEALAEVHTAVTFRDFGNGTRLTVEARAKGFVDLARLMLAGMEQGWSESLEKLAEQLCEVPA